MPITGFVDEVTRSRVRGWVCDPERPGEALWVTIRVNDREVARCSADRHRSDLRQRIGDGNHEFCFDFEPPLSVFEEFAIEVAVAGSTELLQGGTKILPAPQLAKTPGQLIPILLTSTGRAGTTWRFSRARRRAVRRRVSESRSTGGDVGRASVILQFAHHGG